jgi:flagellar hook assembly protein FlgD
VTLEIYNVKGERIRILVDEAKGVGEYSVSWSGDDQTGSRVGSGIYFVRMKSGEYSKLVKMLLLK